MAKYGSVSDAGKKVKTEKGKYDIYPTLLIEKGKVIEVFTSLTKAITDEKVIVIVIDGYIGIFFDDFRKRLEDEFARTGKKVAWISVDQALKEEAEISRMIAPFLGGDDPLFGKRTNLKLEAFFDLQKLKSIQPDKTADLSVPIGAVATLVGWKAEMVYVDLPKNESILTFADATGLG